MSLLLRILFQPGFLDRRLAEGNERAGHAADLVTPLDADDLRVGMAFREAAHGARQRAEKVRYRTMHEVDDEEVAQKEGNEDRRELDDAFEEHRVDIVGEVARRHVHLPFRNTDVVGHLELRHVLADLLPVEFREAGRTRRGHGELSARDRIALGILQVDDVLADDGLVGVDKAQAVEAQQGDIVDALEANGADRLHRAFLRFVPGQDTAPLEFHEVPDDRRTFFRLVLDFGPLGLIGEVEASLQRERKARQGHDHAQGRQQHELTRDGKSGKKLLHHMTIV